MSATVYSASMAVGLLCVVIGCGLVSVPLALIVAGVGIIVLTLLTLRVAGKAD